MSTEFRKSELGDPTWEIAAMFPHQGCWSETEYLRLDFGRLVEFDHGRLEVLTMPTELHQAIAFFLCLRLQLFAEASQLGVSFIAPLRVQLWPGKFREPDVLFMRAQNRHRRAALFWHGADLVMEVVSEDDPQRDLVVKREEYAQAKIPEYWIVDPRDRSILVLVLDEPQATYVESGRYANDQTAHSATLLGFSVSVSEVFNRPEAT